MEVKVKNIVFGLMLVATNSAYAVNDVSFDATDYNVTIGTSFTAAIIGSNFSPLDAGGVNLGFNPSMLSVSDVQIDPTWEFFPTPGTVNNAVGMVDGILFNTLSFAPPSGSISFAKVTFDVIGLGDSTLSLSESAMNPFSGPGGVAGLNFNGAIVHAVPEMDTWAMMIAGMGFLGWRLRMRNEENASALPA